MDSHLEEDDPVAAAMAEAMGFSGFGSQRPAKRKFNANADAAVSASPREKKGGNVSKTGANNAPLGTRRPLQLPPPTSASLPARSVENADEIDLDGDDERGSEAHDLGATAFGARNKLIDALQTPGGYESEDEDSMVVQPSSHTIVDNGPPGLPSRPPHQQSLLKGQNHQHARGGRGGSYGADGAGTGGAPWWEGYYDARINENPWERLEKERGMLPRGTWLARNTSRTPATTGGPSDDFDGGANAAAESLDIET